MRLKRIPKSFSSKKEAEKSGKIYSQDELKKIIEKVLKKNKKSVNDYKNGETKAFNFLMGQVMHKTNKRADYQTVIRLLEKELKD